MGNSLNSRIFIKSAEYLTSLKFGLMITWVNNIVQKIFHCHSNKHYLAVTISQRVYRGVATPELRTPRGGRTVSKGHQLIECSVANIYPSKCFQLCLIHLLDSA